jgi:hypothetical protein
MYDGGDRPPRAWGIAVVALALALFVVCRLAPHTPAPPLSHSAHILLHPAAETQPREGCAPHPRRRVARHRAAPLDGDRTAGVAVNAPAVLRRATVGEPRRPPPDTMRLSEEAAAHSYTPWLAHRDLRFTLLSC